MLTITDVLRSDEQIQSAFLKGRNILNLPFTSFNSNYVLVQQFQRDLKLHLKIFHFQVRCEFEAAENAR